MAKEFTTSRTKVLAPRNHDTHGSRTPAYPAVRALGAVLVAALLGYPGAASAQQRDLQQQLEQATRVDCRFTALATGTWEDAAPVVDVTAVDVEAAFFDINIDEATAESEGRFGSTFIVVRYAHGYLHFMEMNNAGPLYLTTVLAQESSDGRMKAVQTRHEYSPTVLPGFTSRPEMYIGDCAVS